MKLVILVCDGTLVDGQNRICLAMAYAGAGAPGVARGYHHAEDLRAAGACGIIETGFSLPAAIDAYFGRADRAA